MTSRPSQSRSDSNRFAAQSTFEPPSIGREGVFNRTAVALEYASLRHANHCPLGIYVIPRSNNIMIWDAVLFVHQGYYADSVLKFRLTFPGDYPEHPPAVDFMTEVFHPLISSNGSFSLSPRFRPWRAKDHHVFDVLHWVKAAFKKHALDQLKENDCFNKEAFRYHESSQSFAALASQTATLSHSASTLFEINSPPSQSNPATSEFTFHKLTPAQLQKERSKLGLQSWEDSGPTSSSS